MSSQGKIDDDKQFDTMGEMQNQNYQQPMVETSHREPNDPPTDFRCSKETGAMSFGEKANPLDSSNVSFEPLMRDKSYSRSEKFGPNELEGRIGHGSLVSIKDI